MEPVLSALLFGAALWLVDLYTAKLFRHFYPELKPDLRPKGAPRWKRTWVYENQALKYAGLIVLWSGWTLGTYLPASNNVAAVNPFNAAGFLGLMLYIGSRLWLTLIPKPRSGRNS